MDLLVMLAQQKQFIRYMRSKVVNIQSHLQFLSRVFMTYKDLQSPAIYLMSYSAPGPVTVVLKRGESSFLETSLNPGVDSIGVRVPDSNFIRAIARGCGGALALTSANFSGQPSSVDVKDFENMWQHCACIYDGGVLPAGHAGSTVVDLTVLRKYKIIRPGSAMNETVAILERHVLW